MVLLVASLAVEVSSTNVKNGMGNTNTMSEDERDVKRKLTGEDDTLIYTKTYIAVTKAADFVRLFPNGGDIVSFFDDFITKALAAVEAGGPTFKGNPEFSIQGSSTTQKGMYIIISYILSSCCVITINCLSVCVYVFCCLSPVHFH